MSCRRPLAWLPLALTVVGIMFLLAGCATTTRTTTTTTSSGTSTGNVDVDDRPLKACSSSDDCDGDEYCRYALGACGGTGSCEPRPEVCTFEFDPVCACDQNTYSNACAAASEGLSILKPGRCGTDG